MAASRIEHIARNRFDGWRNRERFTQLIGELLPSNMDEAYEAQAALYALMRDEAGFTEFAGHKVALTSPAIQEMCGVDHPAYGAIFREFVHQNKHEADPADFIRLGIEFEVAFKIGDTLPNPDTHYDAQTVRPFIESAMPAFELIDDRDADYAHLDGISILCDRCWCNGIVLGEALTEINDLDFANLRSEVEWNGVIDEEGNTGWVLENPLNSIAFVANHLNARGKQLRAGEIVMTGSALKTRFPVAGDHAMYRVEGLGEVVASVAVTG